MTAPAPFTRSTIEDALHGWLVAATGITPASVIWANQDGLQPGYPFATLNLGDLVGRGRESISEAFDAGAAAAADAATAAAAAAQEAAAAAPGDEELAAAALAAAAAAAALAGLEITLTASRQEELTLSVNVFSRTADPDAGAAALMDRARGSLALATYLTPLRVAGLAVVDRGPTRNLDALVATRFVQRRQMDVRLRLATNVVETAGYIATFEVTPTINDVASDTFTVEIP